MGEVEEHQRLTDEALRDLHRSAQIARDEAQAFHINAGYLLAILDEIGQLRARDEPLLRELRLIAEHDLTGNPHVTELRDELAGRLYRFGVDPDVFEKEGARHVGAVMIEALKASHTRTKAAEQERDRMKADVRVAHDARPVLTVAEQQLVDENAKLTRQLAEARASLDLSERRLCDAERQRDAWERSAAEASAPGFSGRWGAALVREAQHFDKAADPCQIRDATILRAAAPLVRSEADARLILAALGWDNPDAIERVLFAENPGPDEDGR